MDRDIINLMKDSISTFLNIAQMTQYRMGLYIDYDSFLKPI